MMLLTGMGSTSFMFAMFMLFCWRPGVSLETRLEIAGIYLTNTAIAAVGVCIRMKQEFPSR